MFRLLVLTIISLAQPQSAFADSFSLHYGTGDGRYARHDHNYRGWDRPNYGRYYPHYRGDRVVIVQQPYANNTIYYDNSYPAPTYQEIRCTNEYNPFGILLGGTAGGLLGSTIGKGNGRTAAIIGGAVLGAGAGHSYTRQRCSTRIFQEAPVGVPISWQNVRSNEYYAVTPTRAYQQEGRYCREYQAVATIGQRREETYGTACMQPDGSWQVVN